MLSDVGSKDFTSTLCFRLTTSRRKRSPDPSRPTKLLIISQFSAHLSAANRFVSLCLAFLMNFCLCVV